MFKNLKNLKNKVKALILTACIGTFAITGTAFASVADPMADFVTDAPGIFDVIVEGAKSVAELFTVWPVNLFLIFAILGVAVGVIMRFKNS